MTNQILERISTIGNSSCKLSETDYSTYIPIIASKKLNINEDEARALIRLISNLFKKVCLDSGFNEKSTDALKTKLRDAGRRSAPWKHASSKVPGIPQDGADGNRRNRWLFRPGEKFYASEIIATLVEVKYYLQALSMEGAPDISEYKLESLFSPWLLEHDVKPSEYHDPVQLTVLKFRDFMEDPRTIQSGHIFPLDRGGTHNPTNTFLMLSRSNQLQGNNTVEELLELMRAIVSKHDEAYQNNNLLEKRIKELTPKL